MSNWGERTKHPAAGCTKAQRNAFERIATGDDSRVHPETAKALIAKGLIESEMVTVGHDRFGAITVASYTVPLLLHMQWCQWCSEQTEAK